MLSSGSRKTVADPQDWWRNELHEAEEILRRPESAEQPTKPSDAHRGLKKAISRIRGTLEDMSKRFAYEVAPPPPPGAKRDKITLRQLKREIQKRFTDNADLARRVGLALIHISKYCHPSAQPASRTDVEGWLGIAKEFLSVMASKIEMTSAE